MAQRVFVPQFTGGVDNSKSELDIPDNALVTCKNFELTEKGLLQTRAGTNVVYSGSSPFTSAPITSIFRYRPPAGECLIYTNAAKVFRRVPTAPADGLTGFTEITNSLDFLDGRRWRWVQFDDVAIGVNSGSRAAGKHNPVVLASPTASLLNSTASGVGGDDWLPVGTLPDAPEGIIVWNRRVWVYEGNEIHGCAAGDRTDHTTTGGAGVYDNTIGADEGDLITGWTEWQDRLIIFKENRIYEVVAGSPNVDTNQYEIRSLTNSLGCVHQETIQHLLGDVLFLSHHGVVSLTKLLTRGEDPIISRAITELQGINTNATYPAAYAKINSSQYWLSVPTATTRGADNTEVWVADLRFRDERNVPPWFQWDGAIAGAAYAPSFIEDDGSLPIIGGSSGQNEYPIIGGYGNAYVFDSSRSEDSSGSMSNREFVTKAFDLDEAMKRKDFYRVGVQLHTVPGSVAYTLRTELDLDSATRVTHTATLSGPSTVGQVVHSLRGPRRGKSLNFRWSSTTAGHAYLVRGAFFDFDVIDQLTYANP